MEDDDKDGIQATAVPPLCRCCGSDRWDYSGAVPLCAVCRTPETDNRDGCGGCCDR